MTQTQQPAIDAASAPQDRIDTWLADFEAALSARDVERAVSLFGADSYWRDLVSFTWNITTSEGREQIAEMLDARLADTDPSGFRTSEPAAEDVADGVVITSAFIEFETAVGRGVGHLRLKDGQGWTLVTALTELKGYEEHRGATRVPGAVHGEDPDARSWAEKRADEQAALGYTDQPYVLVVLVGFGTAAPFVIGLAAPTVLAPCGRACLLYTSPSPRDRQKSRMPSSA